MVRLFVLCVMLLCMGVACDSGGDKRDDGSAGTPASAGQNAGGAANAGQVTAGQAPQAFRLWVRRLRVNPLVVKQPRAK